MLEAKEKHIATNSAGDRDLVLESYERDGVVRVRGFFDAGTIAQIRERLDHYQRDILPGLNAGDYVLEADQRTVRNLWRMEQHDPWFVELATSERILSLVGPMVHGEPVLAAVETFNKSARVGSGVPYHQDNAYFCQSPPDMLTFWIAIDPATAENGPVYYVTGSHRQGVLPCKPSGVAGNSTGMASEPETPLDEQFRGILDAGDVLIHHCQTIHHSAPNRSDRPRLGLLFVFRGAHTRNDPQLQAAYEASKRGAVAMQSTNA